MLSFEFTSRYFTPFFTALFGLFIPNTAGNKLITYTNGSLVPRLSLLRAIIPRITFDPAEKSFSLRGQRSYVELLRGGGRAWGRGYTNGCVGWISSALALAQIPDMMLQCTAAAADSDLIGETHYERC